MNRINCDIFMKDGSSLDLTNEVVCITGNFYGGNDCHVSTAIIAGENVIFEDYAETVGICAGGSVFIGRFSKTGCIFADKDIVLDDYSTSTLIFAEQEAFLGYDACAYGVTAEGGIIASEYPTQRSSSGNFFSKLLNFLFKN